MELMTRLLDMISTWERMGQAIFFLIVLSGLSAFILAVIRYIVIMLRGYPPAGSEKVIDFDEDTEE